MNMNNCVDYVPSLCFKFNILTLQLIVKYSNAMHAM